MPLYDFKCTNCNTVYKDVKIKLSEKESTIIQCDKCQTVLVQCVAPLTFNLKGAGWFKDQYGDSDSGTKYEITQNELNRNLELEKRKEDEINELITKDNTPKEF